MTEAPLTQHIPPNGGWLDIAAYEGTGGYQALRKAIPHLAPVEIQEMVKASNLRGRGGAGFSTGTKWSLIPKGDEARRPTYMIVNADEMEPGTFKDRFLLEGNPHQLVEGLILSAYAIQADVAYIFVRWAYHLAVQRLRQAVAEAQAKGYIGKNILGGKYSLEMHVHASAGRYMCGEETALLNALEGKRATPRTKPPYPSTSGLWGQPTVVNNVETICNISHIVLRGAEWFRKLSHTNDGGTKLYGASGRVRRPGLWELPMGTTIREILEEHAGGMREGFSFRGVLPGGASTDFLVEEHLDVRMDFESVQKAGSRLGTGTMVVLDNRTCPVGMIRNLEQFFARESCGWCTPCRDGLPWTARILGALEEGSGQPGDLQLLEDHCRMLGPGRTFCSLAPGAVEPLQSGMKFFRKDFEQHIFQKGCPWR